ncbi:MAG: FAD:protein FMN transferase [Planctomycetales bacterium]|nr:FAD:protein FMN transferase [Planctomycetales bacterium]
MSDESDPAPKEPRSTERRDFLTGKLAIDSIRQQGEALADQLMDQVAPASHGSLRLATRAMACEFSVMLNPDAHRQVMLASAALDLVHQVESELTVYREDSDVIRLNQHAYQQPVCVSASLFQLFQLSMQLASLTNGAFDLTSGPLITLWRSCRTANRIPTEEEIAELKNSVGMQLVALDEQASSIRFLDPNVTVNFGAIGKGFALDRMADELTRENVDSFLIHGGHSSILARGDHNQTGGWPVGIGNPLFPERRLGTVLLQDQAMGTSGSNVQYFRCQGRKFGHILDPRTGWPVDGTLSVTAFAPTAAEADALSTAFFVMGEDQIQEFCAAHPGFGAIVVPFPKSGKRVQPGLYGVDANSVFWDSEQVV